MSEPLPPLRSVLFLPASNPRAVDKARTLACDAVILDLEDAVGPEDKAAARAGMAAALAEGGFEPPLVAVRVNGLDTPWGAEDLAAVAAAGPDAVVIPKVSGVEALEAAAQALKDAWTPLWANIETCSGVLQLGRISAAAKDLGVEALVFGQNDLSRDMGLRPSRDRRALHAAMSLTVTAARAAGLAVVDGVFNDFTDREHFEDECREGRAFGFDGKAVIHPSQIAVANRVFSPDEADLAWARAVVEAFALPENAGKGAVRVGGAMAERLHLEQAERWLGLAGR